MVCGFSKTESNSYCIWNPKTRRVVESRNVVFIDTPSNLLPAARQLSPQQDLESPSYDFSDGTLDGTYVSHDDMLPDVQNYTSALDFGIDTPAGTVELLLPQQALPSVTLPGGSSPAGISPGELYRRDHHLHQRPRQPRRRHPCLHQDQRLHLLLRHQGQLTDTPTAGMWESLPPLRGVEPQAVCLCLSLHITG